MKKIIIVLLLLAFYDKSIAQSQVLHITNITSCTVTVWLYAGDPSGTCIDYISYGFSVPNTGSGSITINDPSELNDASCPGGYGVGTYAWNSTSACATPGTTFWTRGRVYVSGGTTMMVGISGCSPSSDSGTDCSSGTYHALWTPGPGGIALEIY